MSISIILPQTQLPAWSGPVNSAIWPVDDGEGNTKLLSGAAFIGGISGNLIGFATATAGRTTNLPAYEGKSINAILRPGGGACECIAGTPAGTQVQWNVTTCDATTAENQDWLQGEPLMIFYTN